MAIVEDAAAPGTNPLNTAASWTSILTGAFSPPANSTVVCMVATGWGTSAGTITVTDSSDANGSTWASSTQAGVTPDFGVAKVAYRQFTSAPGSIQVRCNTTGTAQAGSFIYIKTLTGVATGAPTGATGNTTKAAGTTAFTNSITTTVIGSYVAGVADLSNAPPTPVLTAAANTTKLAEFIDTGDSVSMGAFKQTVLTASPGAITLGISSSVASPGSIAMLEFLPAAGGGTVANDAPNPIWRPGFMVGSGFPAFMAPRFRARYPVIIPTDGAVAGPITYQQPLNADLGFTGSESQSIGRSLLAALGFTVDSAGAATIVEDAAAPSVNPIVPTGAFGTITTNAFSPPANSTVVCIAAVGWDTTVNSITVTDSSDANASTWTKVQATGPSGGQGASVVAYRQFVAAPGSIQVRCVASGTAPKGPFIYIKTLTGVDMTTPTGATPTFNAIASTGTWTRSITTTTVGSYVAGIADMTNPAVAPTVGAAANSTLLASNINSTDGIAQGAFKQTALTTTPGATTLGLTLNTTSPGSLAMVEFLPGAGVAANGLTRLIRTARNATVGFTSSMTRQAGKAFNATLSFVGSVTTPVGILFFQALNATIGFTSSQALRIGKALSGTVSFTGSRNVAVSKVISATVGSTGALTRLIRTTRNATLGFAGALTRRAGKALNATLSFTGSIATQAVLVFQQALNATVGFTSSQTRRTGKAIAATVGFTGSITRRAGKSISAVVGFAGSTTRRTAKQLGVATLSFTASATRRTSRAISATVGFTSSLGTAAVLTFTQALNATVGFTASQTRRAGKGLAATVGFTSSQARRTAKQTVAALSFTSSQTRRTVKQLGAGALGFTGSTTRRAGKVLSATVGFTGSIATQAVLVIQKALNATVGFTGSLASSRIVSKALSATVGFTASQTRRAGKVLSATVSFTSSQTRRIGKQIVAALPFTVDFIAFSDAIFIAARKALAAVRAAVSGGSARSSSSPGSTAGESSTGTARSIDNDASGRPTSSTGDIE